MDSIAITDNDNITYDDSDDRAWLKLDDDARPNYSIGDEKTTIEMIQQVLQRVMDSVENSCGNYGGCKNSPTDDSEYAVEGMLSLTNSTHLGQFAPLSVLASKDDVDEFPVSGEFHDGTLGTEMEEEEVLDTSTLSDESTR